MNKLFFSTVLLLSVLLGACNAKTEQKSSDSSEKVQTVSAPGNIKPAALDQLMKEKADFLLIDVRTPDEVASGQLEGAQHIDFFDSDFNQKIVQLDKSKPVYVYCAVGGRSGKAAKLLSKAGYEVYNLEGGIKAWKAQNLPVTKP